MCQVFMRVLLLLTCRVNIVFIQREFQLQRLDPIRNYSNEKHSKLKRENDVCIVLYKRGVMI